MRAFVAIAVVATSIDAARIAIAHESDSKMPFVASCEDLQGTFRNRVTAVQALLDQTNEAQESGSGSPRFAQARIAMRTFGVVRTLRRAKDCQWAIDGDSEDIEQARSVVQQLLAQNPCAEAAMAEITPEAFESASYGFQPLRRAMMVLASETCEVPEEEEEQEEIAGDADIAELEHRLDEGEGAAQDHIDELFEQAALETESTAGGSFAQTEANKRSFNSVMRVVGAVFFGLLFALVCVPGAAFMVAFIAMILCAMAGEGVCGGGEGAHLWNAIGYGGLVGGGLAYVGCAIALVDELVRAPTADGLQ